MSQELTLDEAIEKVRAKLETVNKRIESIDAAIERLSESDVQRYRNSKGEGDREIEKHNFSDLVSARKALEAERDRVLRDLSNLQQKKTGKKKRMIFYFR